jgi:hypothetical protein
VSSPHASSGVEVRRVRTLWGRHRFVDLPFRLFRHDPDWIPPLRLTVYDRISPRHPAAKHQMTALWMARRRGQPVARLGACVDSLFNEFQGLSWGWVGFFESFDDPEAAGALFEVACRWLATRGCTEVVGPASFTLNDECGLLIDGFENAPYILTTHNPRYYERLWVGLDWEPAMDLWAWHMDPEKMALSSRQHAVLERLKQRAGITVRSLRMDDFDREIDRFLEVYNAAWSRNWGFGPMTEAEVRHTAKDLKRIIDPDLVLFAERASTSETVGAALVVPDANEAMRRVRSGRLLPLGWWHLLRGVPKVGGARVVALGVKPEAEMRAIGPVLYSALIGQIPAKPHITRGEASWVLASNDRMNGALEAVGATRSKTWRMYRRSL